VRRAVLVGGFELQHDVAGAVAFEPFIGDGGAGDRAAQVFEFLPLMGGAAHFGGQLFNPGRRFGASGRRMFKKILFQCPP
jgi:hypothetical protein